MWRIYITEVSKWEFKFREVRKIYCREKWKNGNILNRKRGKFAKIKMRANNALRRQRESLPEGLAESDDLVDIKGTVFGFVGPEFFAGVSVSGVHCCFLSDRDESGERKGGSFIDFETVGEAEVSWAVTGRFHLGFPRGDEWEQLDIKTAISE